MNTIAKIGAGVVALFALPLLVAVDAQPAESPRIVQAQVASDVFAAMSQSTRRPPASHKDAAVCYQIRDWDARSLCLAKAHRGPGACYTIGNADLRAQCQAAVSQ